MDDSTLRIIEKTASILKKSSVVNEDEFQWSRYSQRCFITLRDLNVPQ